MIILSDHKEYSLSFYRYLSVISAAFEHIPSLIRQADEATDESSQGGKAVTPSESQNMQKEIYFLAKKWMGWEDVFFQREKPDESGFYFVNIPEELTHGKLSGLNPGVTMVNLNLKGEGAVGMFGRSPVDLSLIQGEFDAYQGDEVFGWQGPIRPLLPQKD